MHITFNINKNICKVEVLSTFKYHLIKITLSHHLYATVRFAALAVVQMAFSQSDLKIKVAERPCIPITV